MNLLIIENSTPWLSIALQNKDSVIEREYLGFDAAEILIAAVEMLLKEAGLCLSNIDAFGLGIGPGSFTGLRIACSTIKGFALSKNKPVLSLSSLWAIAKENSILDRTTAVISDARKGMVYTGLYKPVKDTLRRLRRDKLENLDRFLKSLKNEDYLFTGESFKYKDRIGKYFPKSLFSLSVKYPKAKYLISLAEEKYKGNDFTRLEDIEPHYLHKETCQVKKK